MGRKREAPSKEALQRIAENFWWDPALVGDELALAVVSAARGLQEAQSFRADENLINLGFYRGVELQGLSDGNRLSAARFAPSAMPNVGAGSERALPFVRNVTKAVTDGAVNKVARRSTLPRFTTDGGTGGERATARKMDKLVRGVFQSERVHDKGETALKSAAVFGTGCLKVVELADRLCVEHTNVDELLVDEGEGYTGSPRTIFQVRTAHRSLLARLFPDREDAVLGSDAATSTQDGRSVRSEHVEVFEAWRLPSFHGAGDGRHVVAVGGGLLDEEPWEQDHFPFVFVRWSKDVVGFWGEGVAAALRGTQVCINRITRRIYEAIKKFGMPKLVLDGGEVSESAKDREMNVVRVKGGGPPQVVFPRVLMGQEVYDYLDSLESWCFKITGVSEMDATGEKPPGLYSGEAIRSWGEQTSSRFSQLVQGYEDFYVQLAERLMEAGQRIAKREGSYVVRLNQGAFVETLDFKDVDLDRDRWNVFVLSTADIPQSFSGRLETLTFLRDQGLIDQQTFRDNLDIPDVESVMDLSNAPEDSLRLTMERMLSTGDYEPPDEMDDLDAGIRLFAQAYHLKKVRGGPNVDRDMGLLRRWWAQAVQMRQAGLGTQQPQAAASAPAGAPGVPVAGAPGGPVPT